MNKISAMIILTLFLIVQTVGLSACENAENIRSDDRTSVQSLNSTINNPEEGNASVHGHIYFGSYPQKDVTEDMGDRLAIFAGELPTDENDNAWTSYGYYMNGNIDKDYMWYKDVDLNGDGINDYRGVYFTDYRPDWTEDSRSMEYQMRNEYYPNVVYWFEFEPVKWEILDIEDGKAIIFAKRILDSQDYNHVYVQYSVDGSPIYGNNYQFSSVRAWLNDTFYNTAFNETEKLLTEVVEVVNTEISTMDDGVMFVFYSDYVCENTYDRVFLLSAQEVTKSKYGFENHVYSPDTARQKTASDYAKIQSACAFGDDYGYWWLRTPSEEKTKVKGDSAMFVHPNSKANNFSRVNCTPCGIVPALKIALPVDVA
ncbi:MAG: hypothetical protein J5762_03520 [Clostridia bacterium]|nr:hypothetical protein [Clostridia bacterium]